MHEAPCQQAATIWSFYTACCKERQSPPCLASIHSNHQSPAPVPHFSAHGTVLYMRQHAQAWQWGAAKVTTPPGALGRPAQDCPSSRLYTYRACTWPREAWLPALPSAGERRRIQRARMLLPSLSVIVQMNPASGPTPSPAPPLIRECTMHLAAVPLLNRECTLHRATVLGPACGPAAGGAAAFGCLWWGQRLGPRGEEGLVRGGGPPRRRGGCAPGRPRGVRSRAGPLSLRRRPGRRPAP